MRKTWQEGTQFFNARKKWAIHLIAIALVSSALVYLTYRLWVNRLQSTDVPAIPISSSQIPRSVVALGRIEPQGEITQVSAPATIEGTRIQASELFVKEGDYVQAGQMIARLDSYERDYASLELAKRQLQVAQSQLDKSQFTSGETAAQQARINRLTHELNIAQREYQRYQDLFLAGAISASLRDSKQLVVSNVQGQLQEAKATLKQLQNTQNADQEIAQAEVESAIATVAKARANFNLATVKAPVSGQVLDIYTQAGEGISEQGILELGQTQQMVVVAEVYETEIHRVQLGNRAVITSSGLPERLQGTVAEIGFKIGKQAILDTDPLTKEDARVVEVKINLNPEASQRVKGLTNLRVKVEIQPHSLKPN